MRSSETTPPNNAGTPSSLAVIEMVASFDTVAEIAKVMRRYVDEETYGKILSDLERVSGSRSFRETIERLRIWERRTRRKEERK